MLPNVHIVTIDENSLKCKNLSEFLDSERIGYRIFKGIDGVGWGLKNTNQYKFAVDEQTKTLRPGQIGCYLSHYWLWRMMLWSTEYERIGAESQFTVLEDDCLFKPDWKENLMLASQSLPKNWDVLMIGSCCTEDKPRISLGANLYELKYPFCTHGYILKGKCLNQLVNLSENMWGPIDIVLATEIFPKLNVYTILPRLCDQYGIDLPA